MKISSALLAKKIREIEGVIPSKTTLPVLQSLLVKNGYLIASNTELTVMVKLEGMESNSETFLLPPKAYSLLKNITMGETEITSNPKYQLTIKNGNIKSIVASQDPNEYSFEIDPKDATGSTATIDADVLKSAIGCCMFAVDEKDSRPIINSVHLNASLGTLNVVGIDNFFIAWNKAAYDGDLQLLIPYKAAQTLLKLDIKGPVTISVGKEVVKFVTREHILQSRLSMEKTPNFEKMFADMPLHTSAEQTELSKVLNRIYVLGQGDNKPAIFDFKDDEVLVSFSNSLASYQETVALDSPIEQPVKIAFNPKYLLDIMKVYPGALVNLELMNSKAPMLISADDSNLKSLILPVNIGA